MPVREQDLPSYLRRRMTEQGVTSLRELARRCDIGIETARRLLAGDGAPGEATLARVADGLPAPLPLLRSLAGRPAGEQAPFALPDRANQLDHRQRALVIALVDGLLDTRVAHQDQAEGDGLRLVGRLRHPDGPDRDDNA